MAVDFPNTPTLNQQFSAGGVMWQWDGTKWIALGGGATLAPIISPVFTGDPQCPLAPVGDNDTSLANTQFVTRADANLNTPSNVGRNLLHNGQFLVTQRGLGSWTGASGPYTADRWQIYSASPDTSSAVINTLTDANRSQIGDEAAQQCLSMTFTGSATVGAYSLFQHQIESVRRLAGKTLIFSFYASASAATTIGTRIGQIFGTGGSPSGNVDSNRIYTSIGTSWARYYGTLVMPSVAGKTFGTNAGTDKNIMIMVVSDSGDASTGVHSGTINFWGMQLEVAQPGQTIPSNFEKISYDDDLRHCQRYYQRNGMLWGWTISASIMSVHWTPTVPMRAAPTANLLTTTPYGEQLPWTTGRTGSGSTVNNTHNTQQNNAGLGYDLQITGFSGMAVGGFCSFAALQLEFTADL